MKGSVSPRDWINLMVDEAPLAMGFHGRSLEDWKRWHGEWLPKLRELMGRLPSSVPLDAEIVEHVELEQFVWEKVVYQVDSCSAVPAYVLVPRNFGSEDRRPAILCAHGHGSFGKEAVAGIDDDRKVREMIEIFNYDYARQLTLRGYVTIVPDWRAFGERYDRDSVQGRDPCNMLQNSVSWLGYNLLSLDIFDARVAIDYLGQRPDVDSGRIGMVGLSYGGRVTTFTTALEPRVRVAVVSGALNLFVERIRSRASCGSQVVPGLLRWGDVPEVLGLIAPRPLLIERGRKDQLLPADYFKEGYSRLDEIYHAAGASDKLAKDEFDGGHRFHGTKALEWFDRWL